MPFRNTFQFYTNRHYFPKDIRYFFTFDLLMKLELLIQKFQEKDIVAFEQLYDMYAKNICGAINIIVKNDALAEEICQDVFMKIWQKSDHYNASKGRFFTWVLNIARNAAIDTLRSKSYRDRGKNISADYFTEILELEDENEEVAVDLSLIHI